MDRINIMVNGMPGKMAVHIARHAMEDDRYRVLPYSLTGPEISAKTHSVESVAFQLLPPHGRDQAIATIQQTEGSVISVDYTHPSAVNANADFYAKHGLPFVMGTTGGDRKKLMESVRTSAISAVIAPNMAKQIVGFQAMMEFAAETFPGLFKGYCLDIRESHQKGKADTSGTARAMVGCFNQLGIPFTESDIRMVRDPETQEKELGVPHTHLSGHAWHWYTLVSEDDTVTFQFVHNVNGRDIYAKGTLDAIEFLHKKLQQGTRGAVYTMIDVLKGA